MCFHTFAATPSRAESLACRANFTATLSRDVSFSCAGFVTMSAAAIGAQRSEVSSDQTPQPALDFSEDVTAADILVDTLIASGATHAFGIVGDGINSIIEALRRRTDRICGRAPRRGGGLYGLWVR